MRKNASASPIVCPKLGCGKSFQRPSQLRYHMKNSHSPLGTHVCRVCAKTFKEEPQLLRHSRVHASAQTSYANPFLEPASDQTSDINPFSESFYRPDDGENNAVDAANAGEKTTLRGSNLHKCTFCGALILPQAFAEHISQHYSLVFYEDRAQRDGQTDNTQSEEQLEAVEQLPFPIRNSLPDIKWLVCCKCVKRFPNASYLLRHTEDFHGGKGQIALVLD